MGADATQLYAAHLAHRRSHRHTTDRHRQHHPSHRPEWPGRGHAARADLGDLHAAGDEPAAGQQHLASGALKVEAYSQDNTMKLDEGSLDFIDNEIVQTTGSVRLRANFPNKAHRLWPGELVNAWLLLDTRHNGLTVSASAGQQGPQGPYVYVINADSTVAVRPVKVAQVSGGQALIDSGLSAGGPGGVGRPNQPPPRHPRPIP